ncbi:MAG TPA: acyl carrier protein [Pseudonocardiaceae bacterium]|nr:acyl carrier protein [Pseudonocardiaceae bacterium]
MTTTASLRACLQQTLTEKFQVDSAAIADASTLDDLGLDSLAVLELIDFMAADLGLQLQDDTLDAAMTVEEAVEVLRQGGAV